MNEQALAGGRGPDPARMRPQATRFISGIDLLTMSSSILLKKAMILEAGADHLFVMESAARQRHYHLRAARVRKTSFLGEEIPVALQPDFLEDLKNEAVASRRILIPLVSRI
jgi:hypothetical protein